MDSDERGLAITDGDRLRVLISGYLENDLPLDQAGESILRVFRERMRARQALAADVLTWGRRVAVAVGLLGVALSAAHGAPLLSRLDDFWGGPSDIPLV